MTGACLTVSQVQSIPWSAASSSTALLLVTIGVCHSDCHEGECRKALCDQGCSSARSARLFPEERDGHRLAQYSAKLIGCCRAARYGVSGARAQYV